jgi:GTPase SAR1 family protein
MREWARQLQADGLEEVPKLLVGNKADLEEKREVTKEEVGGCVVLCRAME